MKNQRYVLEASGRLSKMSMEEPFIHLVVYLQAPNPNLQAHGDVVSHASGQAHGDVVSQGDITSQHAPIYLPHALIVCSKYNIRRLVNGQVAIDEYTATYDCASDAIRFI